MIAKCANPNCEAAYKHRTGRLFYLRQPKCHSQTNTHSVKHYWLCQSCSAAFKLEYRECQAALTVLETTDKKMAAHAH